MRTLFKWILLFIILALLLICAIVYLTRKNNDITTASPESHTTAAAGDNSQIVTKRSKELQLQIDTYCHRSLLEAVSGQEGALIRDKTTSKRFRLVQAHVLLRHGDRTPESRVHYLPEVNFECGMVDGTLNWRKLRSLRIVPHPLRAVLINARIRLFRGYHSQNCKNGQLTFRGFNQHLKLGQYFRERYNNLYYPKNTKNRRQIFIQSTDYKRTIHSAGAFSLGFYSQDKNPTHAPIHVSRGTLLEVPPPGMRQYYPYCTQLTAVRQTEIYNSSYLIIKKSTKPTVDKLLNAAGIRLAHFSSITEVFDPVWCRLCHEKSLPCSPIEGTCFNESLLLEGIYSAHSLFSNKYPHDSSILISQPYLFHTIIQNMNAAIFALSAGKEDFTRLTFSFGHDTNILALLSNLGYKQDTWPPYASRISVELWQDKLAQSTSVSNYYVRILFNGQSIMEKGLSSREQLINYRTFKHLFTSGRLRELNSYINTCRVN